MSQFCLFLCRTLSPPPPTNTQVGPSFFLVPAHHTKHSLIPGRSPRGCSVFSNIKALYLRSRVSVLVGLHLLSPHLLQPSSTSPVTTVSSPSLSILSSLIPFYFLSQRPPLSPPAVAPHVCLLSSHQYPSASPGSSKRSDPSVFCCLRTQSHLSHSPTPVGKHDPYLHHSLVILSLFCLLNISHPSGPLLPSHIAYLSFVASAFSPRLIVEMPQSSAKSVPLFQHSVSSPPTHPSVLLHVILDTQTLHQTPSAF